MIESETPTMFEKRLMQLGVFGYIVTVLFCGASYLFLQNTQVLRGALWSWAAILMLYGIRLIVIRVGWVPTRRGPQVCRGKVAVAVGTLYLLLGIGLAVIAVIVPSIA